MIGGAASVRLIFLHITEKLAQNTCMLFSKKIYRTLFTLVAVLVFTLLFQPCYAYSDKSGLYLGGFPAGFLLNTTTVEVVGVCDVLTSDGIASPARECGIKSGDIIEKINDREIKATQDVNDALNEDYKKFVITISRDGQTQEMDITPVVDLSSKCKKLGLLVKDSVNGVGTVTFIDVKNKKFGSLGHPVTDSENNRMEVSGGTVYGCIIYSVKKGVRGNPGELKGIFENNKTVGTVALNCSCGIFGKLSEDFDTSALTAVETAPLSSVKPGKAEIYSTVNGNQCKKYDISIVKVDEKNKDNRNFVIKIDDDELIEQSGGIVQGMSGSPIVQNGKLVGAVTHVFINDPTRGFGIGIDKMLSSY